MTDKRGIIFLQGGLAHSLAGLTSGWRKELQKKAKRELVINLPRVSEVYIFLTMRVE
jgi:hypothetical protein